jgi:two-component system alkaline phosphatase synthesis response regulator PhoP
MPEYFNDMIELNNLRAKFTGIVWFDKLRIDIDNYTVEYAKESFKLKPLEIRLLFYLCKHLNRVISRERLLQNVWGYEQSGATRTLDVHIMSLRALLNENHIPLEIQTFRGEGYKLYDTETEGGNKYFE